MCVNQDPTPSPRLGWQLNPGLSNPSPNPNLNPSRNRHFWSLKRGCLSTLCPCRMGPTLPTLQMGTPRLRSRSNTGRKYEGWVCSPGFLRVVVLGTGEKCHWGGGGECISKVSKFTVRGLTVYEPGDPFLQADDQRPTDHTPAVHSSQGAADTEGRPQAGLQLVRSAPRCRRPLLGSFFRDTLRASPPAFQAGASCLPQILEPLLPPLPPTARRRCDPPGTPLAPKTPSAGSAGGAPA